MRNFITEAAFPAPPLPVDRPPTKSEVWTYISHIHANQLAEDAAFVYGLAKEKWAFGYVYFVNRKGWRKQPDWTEGQPIIKEAVPTGPIMAGTPYVTEVERLWQIARAALPTTPQLQLEAT